MKIYALLILLLFSGCRWFSGAETPYLAFASPKVPDGTPIFKKGYEDGCKTIIKNRATGFYRDIYSYNYDTALIDNPEYQFGFSRGWTNCFNWVVSGRHTLGGSGDTYIYGNLGTGPNITKGDINSTINYETGSWKNPFASGNGIDSMFDVIQKGNKGGTGTALDGHPLWGTSQSENSQIFGW
jgi:hypothetical protein